MPFSARSSSWLGWLLLLGWLFVLMLPNLIEIQQSRPAGSAPVDSGEHWRANFNAAVSSLAAIWVLAVLARPWVWLLLMTPFLVWLPVEIYYQLNYLEPTSAHVIAIIVDTNFDEVEGLLAVPVVWVAIVAFVWLLCILLSLVYLKKAVPPWADRTRTWVLIGGGTILLMVIYSLSRGFGRLDPLGDAQQETCALGNCKIEVAFSFLQRGYPWGVVATATSYLHHQGLLAAKRYGPESNAPWPPRLDLLHDLNETYVVVIGESSRTDRWGLAGYLRDTTPALSRVDNLVFFPDVVSVAPATRLAVPYLFGVDRSTGAGEFEFERSWIQAFKRAGFHVTWISSQMKVGRHDTMIALQADLADEQIFVNKGSYSSTGALDGELIGIFDRSLGAPYRKHLIIMHTLGSHTPFARRYPKGFEVFTPTVPSAYRVVVSQPDLKESIDNTYDNTIVYTDWVLNNVILRLQDRSGLSALWYISDHGVSLPSDGCGPTGPGVLSVATLRTPALFWAGPGYVSGPLAEKLSLAAETSRRRLHTSGFAYTLMDSTGFLLEPGTRDMSWISPDWTERPRPVTLRGDKWHNFDGPEGIARCGPQRPS